MMFKRNKVLSLALALALAFCFSSYSKADTTTDLLDPSAQNWSGTYGTGYWQGTGGPAPNRIPNNSGFIWSSDANIIGTTIAINTALEQAGIQVEGFSYKWRVKNGNGNLYGKQPGVDDFKITVDVLKADGSIYQSYVYDYGHSHNWTSHTGSETFANNYLPPSYFSDINISAQGSDSAGWTGHYGPEFNVSASEFNLTYSSNPCYSNPLYDVACPGYATAYFNQQCTANPLYNSGCTGYAAAYLTQQCSSNPLYSTSCSGYSTAYYNQQCSNDALYDVTCDGYASAYYDQQCSVNALYDSGCNGYSTAYYNQQCSNDALYDSGCNGYENAFFAQQCSIDTLYNNQCPGYASAYYDQQCSVNALYDSGCPGYASAYYKQQCTFNPQYDKDCQGYLAETPPGEIVIVDDPIVAEAITLETPIIPEQVIVIEEVILEEPVVEEVIEEVIIVEPKQVDTAKEKTKKIKEIQQVNTQSLADKMSNAATFKVQQQIQTRLIAMLNFVPEFSKYSKTQLDGGQLQKEVNLKGGRIVDNAFARWFVNDPNYDKLEELQYNLGAN